MLLPSQPSVNCVASSRRMSSSLRITLLLVGACLGRRGRGHDDSGDGLRGTGGCSLLEVGCGTVWMRTCAQRERLVGRWPVARSEDERMGKGVARALRGALGLTCVWPAPAAGAAAAAGPRGS